MDRGYYVYGRRDLGPTGRGHVHPRCRTKDEAGDVGHPLRTPVLKEQFIVGKRFPSCSDGRVSEVVVRGRPVRVPVR